jgi:hypothetical protein
LKKKDIGFYRRLAHFTSSHTSGGDILFHEGERIFFFKLLKRLALGFFSDIHKTGDSQVIVLCASLGAD